MMTSTQNNARRARAVMWCAVAVSAASVIGRAQQPPAACAVSGRVSSGAAPLPGVSIVALLGDTVIGATSTEPDGSYRLALPPGAYQVKAELTGFSPLERPLTLAGDPCATQAADMQLALLPRSPRAATAPATARARLLLPRASRPRPDQALAVTGNMASIDRGMMADRMGAIGRGEFDPVTGEFRPGFEPGRRRPGWRGTGRRGGGRGGRGGRATS
jgi:hypothetical protein